MTDNGGESGPLVSVDWVEKHQNDPQVRLAEVDVDREAYDQSHIEGAVGWSWETDLCDPVQRDIIPKGALEHLLGASGVDNDTTLVLYGDNNNWFACWAYWQLRLYGHTKVRIMDGGRKKWILEGKRLTKGVPRHPARKYLAREVDNSQRAFLGDVLQIYRHPEAALVDVRSPDEYSGKILSPPGLPETCQRGGHIPRAISVPWGENVRKDGTFKPLNDLRQLYGGLGITPNKDVVAYCRIGERSSLTWFVLKELLGYDKVRNYDGSWTEWGNLVRAPIERPGA